MKSFTQGKKLQAYDNYKVPTIEVLAKTVDRRNKKKEKIMNLSKKQETRNKIKEFSDQIISQMSDIEPYMKHLKRKEKLIQQKRLMKRIRDYSAEKHFKPSEEEELMLLLFKDSNKEPR